MTRPLLLLAMAAVLGFLWGLWGLWRASEEARKPARWVEPDDAIAPPDPWTTGLLEPAPGIARPPLRPSVDQQSHFPWTTGLLP